MIASRVPLLLELRGASSVYGRGHKLCDANAEPTAFVAKPCSPRLPRLKLGHPRAQLTRDALHLHGSLCVRLQLIYAGAQTAAHTLHIGQAIITGRTARVPHTRVGFLGGRAGLLLPQPLIIAPGCEELLLQSGQLCL